MTIHDALVDEKKRTSSVGAYYELRTAAELVARKCVVFVPLLGDGEIDLIATTPSGEVARLQVKTAHFHSKNAAGRGRGLQIRTKRTPRSQSGPVSYRDIDYFIGWHGDDVWILPAAVCVAQFGVNLASRAEFKGAWNLIVKDQCEQPVLRLTS